MSGKTNIKASAEQKAVIAALLRGENVSIDAVAGSGKSSTLLLAAEAMPDKQFLSLTYNKRLELALTEKIKNLKLTNITVRTYHGAASRAYGTVINNDTKFRAAVAAGSSRLYPLAFDILGLDETQDSTIEYYLFVCALLEKNGAPSRAEFCGEKKQQHKDAGPQIIAVGDPKQAINQYKGSRVEFLTQSAQLYPSHRKWARCKLSTSYRLTPASAAFVNTHILGEQLVVGGNTKAPNRKPVYAAVSFPKIAETAASQIHRAVAQYSVENVAVLAPSTRCIGNTGKGAGDKNPLAVLVREHLAQYHMYIAADDEKISDQLVKGKLLISTYNSMKGCERDAVIILGLDESYFTYYEQHWKDPFSLPNVLYVAATRAIKHLVIVAQQRQTIRTLLVNKLDLAEVIGKAYPPQVNNRELAPIPRVTVTALVRHLGTEMMEQVLKNVRVLGRRTVAKPSVRAPQFLVDFGTHSETTNIYYGIVAPQLLEFEKTGAVTYGDGRTALAPNIVEHRGRIRDAWDITQSAYDCYPAEFWPNVADIQALDYKERKVSDWFVTAVAKDALYNGRHHTARQLQDFDWVDEKFVKSCSTSIKNVLTTEKAFPGKFEVVLPVLTVKGTAIHGHADFIAKNGHIWEFKCVPEVTDEHLVQLACYLALRGGAATTGHLYSFLSGEIVSISIRDGQEILSTLLSKYFPPNEPLDIFESIAAFEREHGLHEADAADETEVEDADLDAAPPASDSTSTEDSDTELGIY